VEPSPCQASGATSGYRTGAGPAYRSTTSAPLMPSARCAGRKRFGTSTTWSIRSIGNLSVSAAFVPNTWRTTMQPHADGNELSAMLHNAAAAGGCSSRMATISRGFCAIEVCLQTVGTTPSETASATGTLIFRKHAAGSDPGLSVNRHPEMRKRCQGRTGQFPDRAGVDDDRACPPGDPLRCKVLDLARTPFHEPWPGAHARHSIAGTRKDRGQGPKTPCPMQGGAVTSVAAANMTRCGQGRADVSRCLRTSAFTLARCRISGCLRTISLYGHAAHCRNLAPGERVPRCAACRVSARVPGRRSPFQVGDRHARALR